MNEYKNARFFNLFIRFAIIFLVIITVFKIVIGFFRFDGLEGLKNEYFVGDKWQAFLRLQIIMSLIYGLIMALYYKFLKK